MSIAVGLLLSAVVIYAWQGYVSEIREARHNKTNLTGQFVTDQFRNVIEANIQQLGNLKERIEFTDGEYLNYWEFDAKRIIRQNPSFKFVEWIDSNMVIRKIEPIEGNEPAIGLDISNVPYRRDQWIQSILDSSINITEWALLTQGGHAFLVDAPVYFDGKFQGTITAGMDFSVHFDQVMAGRDEYYLSLYDNKERLFYSRGDSANSGVCEHAYSAEIPVGQKRNLNWRLSLFPTDEFASATWWYPEDVGLVLGLMVTFMMAVTLYLMLRFSREKNRVSISNTELQRLNNDLETAKRKAEKASDAKTEFLSNMSHEIRTPLNAILGLIDILQRITGKEEEEILKYLSMMKFSSRNLLGLLNDVLEINKIESGKVELVEREFNPLRELRLLVQLYEPSFKDKGLDVKLDVGPSANRLVMGDSLKFNQVLTNLIRNSFKFTQRGGLEVKYREQLRDGKLDVFIVIEDTGIGIPEGELEHIFERFAQVETGYTRKYEGTGLGLSISKMLIDAMGGDISVESTENVGSTFKLHFVFTLSESDTQANNGSNGADAHYAGSKVLIAEDNPLNVLVLSKLLEEFGISADVAGNGMEAVNMVNKESYDLVFMDVHMPEMDGVEATRRLRDTNNTVPIVALSANITQKVRKEAREAGMQEYLTKPFTREAILGILSRFLS